MVKPREDYCNVESDVILSYYNNAVQESGDYVDAVTKTAKWYLDERQGELELRFLKGIRGAEKLKESERMDRIKKARLGKSKEGSELRDARLALLTFLKCNKNKGITNNWLESLIKQLEIEHKIRSGKLSEVMDDLENSLI